MVNIHFVLLIVLHYQRANSALLHAEDYRNKTENAFWMFPPIEYTMPLISNSYQSQPLTSGMTYSDYNSEVAFSAQF